jgi:flagellar protein FliO/FliZ
MPTFWLTKAESYQPVNHRGYNVGNTLQGFDWRMDFMGLLRAVFALAIVLGLILALAYGLKRYAPQLMGRLQAPRGRKRLEVVETLVLDPVRRLVLVRLDDEERLILLGEGRELAEPPVERKAKAIVAQSLAAVETATPAPRPVQAATVTPIAKPKPATAQAVTPRGDASRTELPKPRMYRTAENTAPRATEEVNDDLF